MNNCFIILAAGDSRRFNSKTPKPYYLYKGKSLIKHSIDKAKNFKKFNKIILVINKKHKKNIKNLNIKNATIIIGGKTRAESSLKALNFIKEKKIKNVFVHDAARPNFSIKLLKKLLSNLKKNKAVVPFINSPDSIKYKYRKNTYNLLRENALLTQTPQAFRYKDLYSLVKKQKGKIQDESTLFIQKDLKVKFIRGESSNYKITYQNDMETKKINYGIGFDVHRLVKNKKLFLGGLKIKSKIGTLGHSDGDPVLHAIIDALLGACKMGDIGEKFSDKNKKFKNIRSTILLKQVIDEITKKKFYINNIDINIITQKPKLKKFKKKIIKIISELCNISTDQINIKGKTTEKLGLIGKEKAIACEVIASVFNYNE